MVSTSYEVGCKVEDILSELMQDVNIAAKQRGLYEACAKASGNNSILSASTSLQRISCSSCWINFAS